MMGIMVPETCWASNKIFNKNHLLHLVGILFPHVYLYICVCVCVCVWLLSYNGLHSKHWKFLQKLLLVIYYSYFFSEVLACVKIKVQLSLCMAWSYVGGVEAYLHSVFVLSLREGEWTKICCFTPRKRNPCTDSLGGWLGLRADLDILEKREVLCLRWELNAGLYSL